MAKKLALKITGCAAVLMLLSFIRDSSLSRWGFGLLSMSFPVLLLTVGAARSRGLGPVRWIFALLWAVLTGCLAGMMIFSGTGRPWFGGLPAGGAFLLYGIWLAPLALVSFGYAWAFERFGVREEDLERLRGLKRRRRARL